MLLSHRILRPLAFAGLAAVALLGARSLAPAREAPKPLPPPAVDLPAAGETRSIVLAGGCFWGLQGLYEHVRGVRSVVAGYAGGSADTAHYEMVGTGQTGHAESVRIVYDPREVSYGRLLQIFFSAAHDPTQVGGQGPDEGSQYRSAIFVADAAERRVAEAYEAQLAAAHAFAEPITTEIAPLAGFYPAESYHQDYLQRHPDALYIVINDLPKIAALRTLYPDLYRATPVHAAASMPAAADATP